MKVLTPDHHHYGVHNIHCCRDHGCKYGNLECPVEYGDAPGIQCEECEYIADRLSDLSDKQLLEEIQRRGLDVNGP